MNIKHLVMFAGLVVTTLSPLAEAGSKANQAPSHEPQQIVSFAKDVEKYAAAQGARAFIIARVGRPQKDLPKGIQFTHTAVAIYSDITLDSGEVIQGYAIHNLYQKDGEVDKSQLITDYPVDFFWGAHDLKAGIIIPTQEIQTRLIALISAGDDKRLHNERYSVLANPFNSQFQNCTEYTLDLLNAAIYQTTDIQKLKANASAYFTAQRVHTSGFKLMLGSMFQDDISTKDHKGKVATATFTTIAKYLNQYGLVDTMVTFYSDGTTQIIEG
ncbi:MAG: DUF2145 domain-containing protein [Paraglaciecola sp.]|uniref:DUF2145 domain-containing protein n=1 Tax=Paraglaciecola sp. TaxID=1920173 RepID=UPI00273F8EC3|nr:DUF2145 domain-containing protein [Paraglaciecola sp.]MDP5031572.1 DUF2145 domain-containing protein [Paraglaciecola sp.]MDP5132523.1 DUF2145 domain-containing protein [Paraglaciecola sp.]